jgi:outer membrane receptor for ferrienterochelin and colicins
MPPLTEFDFAAQLGVRVRSRADCPMRLSISALLILLCATSAAAQQSAVAVDVRSNGGPVREAEVVVNGATFRTDAQGRVVIDVPSGRVDITIVKQGYIPVSTSVEVPPNQRQPVIIDLVREVTVEEHVTVSATRTDRGIEDQPMRVEVVDREEIDEKAMMTPGDVVMLLNETGGMRVQATSPSLGAASIRIQGMRGRYTRFLSDGLPLFGEQVSLGLMQIPPLDLGRVEVIKGVASSLYGAGAMSGVVNLVSKIPTGKTERQILVNRSSRGATDAAGWYAAPLSDHWGMTLIGSANGQSRTDVNDDQWADLPKYTRTVVRPRLFWDDQAGHTLFFTGGGTWENRTGGTMPGTSLPDGSPYIEALNTRHVDGGSAFQLVAANGIVWSGRGSWSSQHQDHRFGEVRERDDHDTGFAELTVRRAIARQVVVGGAAFEFDRFQPVDTPRFGYTFSTPGVFVQDDADVVRWLAISASGRLDQHSQYGTFLSPRISALLRRNTWSSRISYGRGFFPSTAITEETEAAGLSRLTEDQPLKAERGRSASIDLTHTRGPLSTTLTLFRARVENPVDVSRTDQYVIRNLTNPTTNAGLEALGVWKTDDFSFVASYAYVRSRQDSEEGRVEVPLTPRHTLGFDAAWESEGKWRVGVEWYYTGTQRLEANPYRQQSEPYKLFGVLVSRRLGGLLLFLNSENLMNVKQTSWDPLLQPSRGIDGRWTVDAWAPLDGRVLNGGVRVQF